MKASIVIANYNNSKYIDECIESLYNQTYKDLEIIFFDDNSHDNSIDVIKNYKNVKIIENKNQTKFGSFNQMNAFIKGIRYSTGDIIFLLDSDDYYRQDKVEKIINFFLRNKDENIVFDYPIIKKNNNELPQEKKINFFNTYWGYIHPTSCISIRKSSYEKIFSKIIDEKFPDIWLDLRILLFSKYIDKYNVINENLTFYRQIEGNVSSKFKKFSIPWWKRRYEAHNYFFNFIKLNKIKKNKNLDFYISKLINRFL